MKTRKTCGAWVRGYCDTVSSFGPADSPATRFEIVATVADDTDLEVGLRTGPDFGCVLHHEKEPAGRPTGGNT